MNKYDKHKSSIQRLFPEHFGTSVAFIDQKGDGYLYNVVSLLKQEMTLNFQIKNLISFSINQILFKYQIFHQEQNRLYGKPVWKMK